MADAVLGIVSGSFAIASLAIQLMELAQKMHAFWQSFNSMNSDVENIKHHLTILQSVSSTILEICKRQPQITCGEAVVKSLRACNGRMNRLEPLVEQLSLEKGYSRSRAYWSRLKTTVKRKTIQEIEASLRGDVTLLLLTLQPFFYVAQRYDATLLATDIKQLSITYATTNPTQAITQNEQNRISRTQESQRLPKQFISQQTQGWHTRRLSTLSPFVSNYFSVKLDSYLIVERLLLSLRISPTSTWRTILRYLLIDFGYISMNRQVYLGSGESLLSDYRMRLKIFSPILRYHFQISSLCRQLNIYPILPCQSSIFKLCLDGDIASVKIWFLNRWVSPMVANQHGENLLHASARYAHSDLCKLLLDLGVDGAAYDDRLWTPLDHLAHNISPGFAFPSRVVDTIRALVERGRCQPLLPLTTNIATSYRGPEEGFAWLFRSEYEGADIEEYDTEDWTLLGDAAFKFGWRIQLCIEDPGLTWQSLYLLRSGANPHTPSAEGRLTPLDTFLRGCTANQIDHATKWLQVLSSAGIDLQQYAAAEQEFHRPEHLLRSTWDEDLWRWIPMTQRVTYRYDEMSQQLEIWLEDYDALSWFHGGRYDLEIFQIRSPAESLQRWTEINAREDLPESGKVGIDKVQVVSDSFQRYITSVFQGRWVLYLIASLGANYIFHVYLRGWLVT